jgi:hypothetical protein
MYNISLTGTVTMNPSVQQIYPNKKLMRKKEKDFSINQSLSDREGKTPK